MTGDSDGSDGEHAAASHERLERKLARSRLLMLAEEAWPRLWLPAAVAVLFVVVSMAGLWPQLPSFVHALLLALFALAFVLALLPLMRLQPPARADALRWLEKRSGLPHRPASTLDDTLPAASDATARRLWRAHLDRMRRHVDAMRTGLPRPAIARFDPYALRVPLVLALFAAIGLAPHRFTAGLAEAFRFGSSDAAGDLRLDAWLQPPAYTGAGTVMLADGGSPQPGTATKEVVVPQHSELVVRVWGVDAAAARLVLAEPAGDSADVRPPDRAAVKTSAEDKVQDMRVKLDRSATAELQLGSGGVIRWPIGVTPDNAPAIALTEAPAATARSALRLSYRLADDYGIAEARAQIRKASEDGTAGDAAADDLTTPIGTPPDIALNLPKSNTRRGNATTYNDLTAHPWAGLPVVLTLLARDDAGNTGRSEPSAFTLPERNFTKPLARAVIKQRQSLAARPVDRLLVAAELDGIAEGIAEAVDRVPDGTGLYLGLRSAYWRLINAADRETVASVVDQLWDIALTIEDGNLSQAERDLRAAQDKLMDALANNAPPEELEKLMKELRQALDNFVKAMAQNQPQNQNAQPQTGEQRSITSQQLDQMLRDIEAMARTGAREAAQQMLSQLRETLESLSRGGQPQQSAGDQQMRRSLDDLGRMIMNQRKLLDETHRRRQQGEGEPQPGEDGEPQPGDRTGEAGQPGMPGMEGGEFGPPPGQRGRDGNAKQGQGGGDLQPRQRQLLNELNGLLDGLNNQGAPIPDDLMRAGSEMGRAERQLGDERLGAAQQHQGRALDSLRKGAQALAEEMMKNRAGASGQTGQDNRDPLGRPRPSRGPEFGEDVKVPDQIDTQRARDILEELRRRASEANRPAEELDYLDRLIRQF